MYYNIFNKNKQAKLSQRRKKWQRKGSVRWKGARLFWRKETWRIIASGTG